MPSMHKFVSFAVIGLLGLCAQAQDLTHSGPAQEHAVFLVGGTVHPVSGEPIENGVVAFNEGKIWIVGKADQIMSKIQLSDDVEIVDCAGKHIYPGLIASVTRMGLTEVGAVRATHDYNEVGGWTPEVRACVSINPDSTIIPVARTNGVLVFGAFPQGGRVPGRASVMLSDGWTWEDMTVEPNAGLAVSWPSVREGYKPFGEVRKDDEDDEHEDSAAEENIKKAMDDLDAFFDKAEAYHAARVYDPSGPVDVRLEAMRAFLPPSAPPGGGGGMGAAHDGMGMANPHAKAKQVQKPLFIRAQDHDQIVSAVTWCAGRSLRCIIVGGRDAPLCAELLKASDVAVIVDGTHRFPKRGDSPHDDPFTLPARLETAGVKWALSTAAWDGNERNLPDEAGRAAAFGLDRAIALRSITLSAAEVLGVSDRLGSIEPGKDATLFVSSGDCLEVTSLVERAWIGGRAVDLSNKQTKLRDKYMDKYRQLKIIDDE